MPSTARLVAKLSTLEIALAGLLAVGSVAAVGVVASVGVGAGMAVNAATLDLKLSTADAADIGKRVWQNECSGTVAGLTSWNAGEEFPSLGIGHFIWYPAGTHGPFDESFPRLLKFLQEHGVKLPSWLSADAACPWPTRQAFLQDAQGERLTELRNLLVQTVPLQAQFIVERLENALPKILDRADADSAEKVRRNFYRVLHSGKAGVFALVDYVNFKGEGVLDSERYNGHGWGLLQVLEGMPERGQPLANFSSSAQAVLKLRVQNSPAQRHEECWLRGWLKRVSQYMPPSKAT
jgi:hypothetical protein